MPDKDYITETGTSNSGSFNPPRINREYNKIQRAKVSPFMPVPVVEEFDRQLTYFLGDGKLNSDQLIFIDDKPSAIVKTNPPLVLFAFIAAKEAIAIVDISVKFDGSDVSEEVTYSKATRNDRNADCYVGHYKPKRFVDPRNQHQVDISISSEKTNSINRSESFFVDDVDFINIEDVAFTIDTVTSEPKMSELFVRIDNSSNLGLEDKQFDLNNWQIAYQNESSFPQIQSIERKPGYGKNTLIITLSKNVESEKNLNVVFKPFDGVETKPFDLYSPRQKITRGGGVSRKAAATCDVCTGRFTGDVEYSPSETCDDDYSEFTIFADCPPTPSCHHSFNEGDKDKIFYDYYVADPNDPDYTEAVYYRDRDFHTGTARPETFGGGRGSTCHIGTEFTCFEYYNHDYKSLWEMKGDMEPFGGPPICYGLDYKEVNMPRADSEKPQFISCKITPEPYPAGPGYPPCASGCQDCRDEIKYYLEFTTEDNHCDWGAFKIFIAYNDGRFLDMTNDFEEWAYDWNPSHTINEWKIYITDPNIFQCADYMKIIQEDKTGNWNSAKIWKGGNTDLNQLPYPTSVTLKFEPRPGPNPYPTPNTHEGFLRQYVNLAAFPENDPNIQVCDAYPYTPAENSEIIYFEVEVIPHISGIEVEIKYEDPSFDEGVNLPPTNKKFIEFPVDEYYSNNNPDLLTKRYYLLWGEHEAYGHDRVTYGDNWNYYPGNNAGIGDIEPPIPIGDDPIIQYDELSHPRATPNFSTFRPDSGTPSLKLYTNKYGKAGVWFNTKKHGGDNFRIKVGKKMW